MYVKFVFAIILVVRLLNEKCTLGLLEVMNVMCTVHLYMLHVCKVGTTY